jgi:hypothetical protein
MKTTYAIAAIAMFAVMLGMSALAPAMAAKPDKVEKIWVCHFAEAEEGEVDVNGDLVEDQWKVINISGNAKKAHVDKHTDGEFSDVELTKEQVDLGVCSDGTHPDSVPDAPLP